MNTPEHSIIDHHVVVLCGDGCLQEGVANEAVAFAGHEKLDNLILMYDSNGVTLDKMAEHTQSEDVQMRFEAQGWEVLTVDGHDMEAVTKAYRYAKESDNGKPTLIVCKTSIGKGIDEIAGTCAAHGEAGVQYADSAREGLGLPADKWFVSGETYKYFADHKSALIGKYGEWEKTFGAWKSANPDKAKALQDAIDGTTPDIDAAIPHFETGKSIATRVAGAEVLQPIANAMPFYVSGSADLHGSNKNYMKGVGDFSKNNYAGRNFYYGIREHAMGAILNGLGFYGLFRASVRLAPRPPPARRPSHPPSAPAHPLHRARAPGPAAAPPERHPSRAPPSGRPPQGSTFLVFSDYMRASVRVAALSHLPINYIWTHDSIGVGEDGPTHQPVETVSSLRMIPNLDVMRPGDAEETAAAYIHAINRKTGPTALILSRQNLPTLDVMDNKEKRAGALKGAYVLVKETAARTHVILSAGSEVHLAVEAAAELGAGCRVVSMPCMELFEAQDDAYKASVLPDKSITTAVEAGVTAVWYKYADKVVGVDSFGESAPAQFIFEAKGITTANIVATAK